MINGLKNKIRNTFKMQFFRSENELTYIQAKELLKENPQGFLIDVRSKQEYDEYHLNGAICIPTYELQENVKNIIENENQIIVVYCQTGSRSKKAINILKKMGYKNLYNISGGIDNM